MLFVAGFVRIGLCCYSKGLRCNETNGGCQGVQVLITPKFTGHRPRAQPAHNRRHEPASRSIEPASSVSWLALLLTFQSNTERYFLFVYPSSASKRVDYAHRMPFFFAQLAHLVRASQRSDGRWFDSQIGQWPYYLPHNRQLVRWSHFNVTSCP
jgi:hypothetical protein